MMPVIFRVPGLGLDVPGYGLMLMIGFLVSIMWAARRAERSGGNPDVVLNCGFIALLGGVAGARFMYVWHNWNEFAIQRNTGALLMSIINVRQGGLEVYGGLIAVVILVLLYLALGRHSIRWYLDIVAPSTALGMAIGRIGCFLNGCCFGGVCDLPWAVRFPYGSPAEVQQWAEHQPGAALPQELLVFAPGGLWPNGASAMPLPRENVMLTSTADIEATQKAEVELLARLADFEKQLSATTDAAQQQRLRAEIDKLEATRRMGTYGPVGGGCRTAPVFALTQMKQYKLSAAELKSLAQQHPSLRVHPAQLYSAITLGLLAALLSAVYWRRTRDGQVICTLLLIEPWTRWVLEIVRADNPVDTLGALTISQFLGIVLSVAGLIGFLILRKMPARAPSAVLWEPPPATAKKSAAERR